MARCKSIGRQSSHVKSDINGYRLQYLVLYLWQASSI